MNIIELAEKCGIHATEIDLIIFSKSFAQAVIEDYKAGLVPVAWMEMISIIDDDGLQSQQKVLHDYEDFRSEPLYVLPGGKTK